MDEPGPSILFSVWGFFTPTVLFVFLNLVIATIALTSRTARRQNHQEQADDDPGRPGLDRIRSIGIFRFGSRDLPQPEPDHHTEQTHYRHQDTPPPSVLERVRSGLFGFGSRDTPQPEPDHNTQQTRYRQDTPPPSVLERVRSGLFGLGTRDTPQPEPDHSIHTQTRYDQHTVQSGPGEIPQPEFDHNTQQTRYYQDTPAPSVLERVRSGLFGLGSRDIPQPEPDHTIHRQTRYDQHTVQSGSREIPQPETHHIQTEFADPDPEPEHYDMDHHFRRIQSESAIPKPVMAEERGALRKLASALSRGAPDPAVLRRRPVAAGREEAPLPAADVEEEEEEEEEEEVDARADDFISRFKKQLQLQRLDSILRYKEMLTRGSSG